MRLLVDIEYANILKGSLLLSSIHSRRPYKLNARCPVCGDSKKSKYKTRFWINEVKTKHGPHLRCSCWNCDLNLSLHRYLERYEPALFERYRVDAFKSQQNNLQSFTELVESEQKENEEYEQFALCKEEERQLFTNVTELPDEHVIKKYMKHRNIPEDKWKFFGFTREWHKLAQQLRPDLYKSDVIVKDHPRLIIPIYNKDGLVAIQGRALTNKHSQKYITIKIDPDFNKIYGTERIDESKVVLFVEGPIDSLFLDNCCAIVGGTVNPDNAPYTGNRIWALDNENRHPDVIKRMRRLLEHGERVVIWDKLPEVIKNEKDINDFIKKGVDSVYIRQYMIDNAVSGLMGIHRLNHWAKI